MEINEAISKAKIIAESAPEFDPFDLDLDDADQVQRDRREAQDHAALIRKLLAIAVPMASAADQAILCENRANLVQSAVYAAGWSEAESGALWECIFKHWDLYYGRARKAEQDGI